MSFFPNPVLAKCPACDAKMTRRPSGWRWVAGDWILWIVFLALALPTGIPLLVGIVLIFTLAAAWNTARDRLYHSYWKWRHPLRCETGGHASPAPEGT